MPPETQAPETGTPAEQAQTTSSAASSSAASPSASQTSTQAAQGSEPTDIKSLPKWAQDHISGLNSENKRRREALEQKELDDKAKAEADLIEQKKFEEVAESRKKELETVKPQADAAIKQAAALNDLLLTRVNKETEKWPKEIKDTAPESTDALVMIAWADKMAPLAEKLMTVENGSTGNRQVQRGTSPGPVPSVGRGAAPSQTPGAIAADDEVSRQVIGRF